MAGTVAADAGSNVEGVAVGAKVLPVKVLSDSGSGSSAWISGGIIWAADQGADVINMSVGSNATSWPESWDEAFLYAEEKDVLVVASAGNRGSGLVQVGAPATIPGVLTVGGVGRDGPVGPDGRRADAVRAADRTAPNARAVVRPPRSRSPRWRGPGRIPTPAPIWRRWIDRRAPPSPPRR